MIAANDLGPSSPAGLRRFAVPYSGRRYSILFYSLLVTLAAGPLLKAVGLDSGLLEVFLVANVLAAALPAAPGTGRRFLQSVLAAVCLLRIGTLWLQHPILSTVGPALWTIVALIAAAEAVRFAIRATAVEREQLYAAMDAYLLFGLFLGVLYWALDRTWPGSLVAAGDASEEALSLTGSVYFSFVTLVTLGYGDVVPRTDAARGLAVVEAVTGQLYLTVMIAYLVSLHVRSPTGGNDA